MKKASLYNINTTHIEQLRELMNNHRIWENPLLKAFTNGSLTISDFRFFFSQYYRYSQNFTKYLTICMLKCDNDFYHAKLCENLWEEAGEENIDNRHVEIYRQFLINCLKVSVSDIEFEPYSELFYKKYIELLNGSSASECAAVLSFGTEGIIGRLYSILREGLLSAGVDDKELLFFNIHIACDDDHAKTLEEMTLSYCDEDQWLQKCKKAVNQALNLRDDFFNSVYKALQNKKITSLIKRIESSADSDKENIKTISKKSNSNKLPINIGEINNELYHNIDLEKGIKFTVDRVSCDSDVLDPLILCVSPGFSNEYHNHAHETVLLILGGEGEVKIDGIISKIKVGDVVFVPRWLHHQTTNTGDIDLKIFAITDYGLTGRLPQNSETVYRQKRKQAA